MKKIICPVCGQEYLQDELFLDLTGKHYTIEKTNSGKIDFYFGTDPEEETTYICDGCNSKLIVKCVPSFTVAVNEKPENYVTKIVPKEKSLF